MEATISDLLFSDGLGKFKLPASVVTQLRQFAQVKRSQPEAGGLLLGRLVLGNVDAVVDEITTPQSMDYQSQFRFFRSAQGHQQILNERWQQSGGTCNYLGEWHTHPEPKPKPSGRDTRSWREQIERLSTGQMSLYFVIVGTATIAVWKANRAPFSYKQLNQIN